MRLRFDANKCVGCGICSLICSLVHEKVTGLEMARIKIKKNYPSLEDPIFKAKYCTHCQKCVKICPTGAISVDENKIVIINEALCSGCGDCVKVCPFDAVWLSVERKAFKCDLCKTIERDPACMKWCPHDALIYR